MKPFIARRFEHVVFSLLLSGMMSLIVSGISTVLAKGFTSGLIQQWLMAWLPSWAIAFPAILVVAPLVRRLVHKLVLPN
jgi:hypothetical protein